MPPVRAFSLAALPFLLILTTLIAAPAANAASVRYVALGDSYAAGVGSGNYISNSGNCKRSTNAYPYLWKQSHNPAAFTFAACSGALTSDVLNNQLPALTSDTTLVSITIGGNDLGFASIAQTCVLRSQSSCLTAVATAEQYATNILLGDLDEVYAAIHQKAPAAHVVVLGYPDPYKIGGNCGYFGLSDTSRTAINSMTDTLNTVIADSAAYAGFTFEDVRSPFAGHEICANGTAWLNDLTWPVSESYHPKAAGQAGGYLPALTAGA